MKRLAVVVAVIVTGCVVASTAQQRGGTRPVTVPPLATPDEVAAPPGWKPDGHVPPHMPITLARLPRTAIARAKYPAIDIHVHAPDLTTDAAYKELVALLDRTGLGAICNMDGGTGAHLDAALKAGAPYRDRVATFITFSADGINEPGWSEKFAAEMERAFKAGAPSANSGNAVASSPDSTARRSPTRARICDARSADPVASLTPTMGASSHRRTIVSGSKSHAVRPGTL
jgi:hypothetical protein